MRESIQDTIDGTSIIDVHEHHFPEILLNRHVNLLQLFRQSYAGWSQRRGYSLPSEPAGDRQPSPDEPSSWEALAPFLESSGSNSFVRNVVRAVADLHGDSEPISHQNWERIDAAVREHHRQPGWCQAVLQRAGIERLITDPYTDPLLDSQKTLGANYDTVLRINASLVVGTPIPATTTATAPTPY